jgi:hypothetical protein
MCNATPAFIEISLHSIALFNEKNHRILSSCLYSSEPALSFTTSAIKCTETRYFESINLPKKIRPSSVACVEHKNVCFQLISHTFFVAKCWMCTASPFSSFCILFMSHIILKRLVFPFFNLLLYDWNRKNIPAKIFVCLNMSRFYWSLSQPSHLRFEDLQKAPSDLWRKRWTLASNNDKQILLPAKRIFPIKLFWLLTPKQKQDITQKTTIGWGELIDID